MKHFILSDSDDNDEEEVIDKSLAKYTNVNINSNEIKKKSMSVYDYLYSSNIPVLSSNIDEVLAKNEKSEKKISNPRNVNKIDQSSEKSTLLKGKSAICSSLYDDSSSSEDNDVNEAITSKSFRKPKLSSHHLSRQSTGTSSITLEDLISDENEDSILRNSLGSVSSIENNSRGCRRINMDNNNDDWMEDVIESETIEKNDLNKRNSESKEGNIDESTNNKRKRKHDNNLSRNTSSLKSAADTSKLTKSTNPEDSDTDTNYDCVKPQFNHDPILDNIPINLNEAHQQGEAKSSDAVSSSHSMEYGVGIVPSCAAKYLKEYQVAGVKWLWKKYHDKVGAILGYVCTA
jgi:hypothetical protein